MASGIPPFLPASPPPMCKLDFYDDDDDDFGDFSNAAENCYQDDILITKSVDDKKSNASQVFDPGSDFKPSNETLIHNHEYSIDDFVHQDAPITHTVENDFSFKKEVIKSDNTDESNEPNSNDIPNDSIKENESSFKPILEFNNMSRPYSNDDNNSVEDSTSDNFDKSAPVKQTNFCINYDNQHSKTHINGETNKTTKDLPLDSGFHIPESSTGVDDDYSGFCSVTEPKETHENDSNFEQKETSLQRAFSEDSDDSNTPDIDFNCFITCSQDLGKQQGEDNFANFGNESCEDEFGDFATPGETDFTSSHPSSSVQLGENRQSELQTCLNVEPVVLVTTDQSGNLSLDPIDDDFSDFISTTTSPSIENTENPNIEKTNLLDQSKSIKKYSSEANSSGITSNKVDFTIMATTSSNNNFEQMYDLSSECWNEIFQISDEEQIEVNLNTFEGKLNGSSVWCKIKDIETSPALNYNWNNSETQKILLSALYVDSRNILFGPRWNSDVPRFASNLGFIPLVPEKASEKKETQPVSISPLTILPEAPVVDDNVSKVPASVPEAHFDWNNSGLTNPLDNHLDLLASFDIHSPYYKNNRKSERTKPSRASTYENSLLAKTPHRKELSEEAKEILNSLPNLFVMEKQYIVFPVS